MFSHLSFPSRMWQDLTQAVSLCLVGCPGCPGLEHDQLRSFALLGCRYLDPGRLGKWENLPHTGSRIYIHRDFVACFGRSIFMEGHGKT